MIEEFKPIIGFSGYYISNFGRIENRITKKEPFIVKQHKIGTIMTVVMVKEGKRTRRGVANLVASHFLPNPSNLKLVKHIDVDETNNNITNLAWTTNKEITNNPTRLQKFSTTWQSHNHSKQNNPTSKRYAPWWNNGEQEVRSFTQPGENWKRGKLEKHINKERLHLAKLNGKLF